MTKVLLEIFSQPTSHTLKIIAGWMLASLGSNWIRFGNVSLQYKKILERIRSVRRAMPSVYESLLARFWVVWNLI